MAWRFAKTDEWGSIYCRVFSPCFCGESHAYRDTLFTQMISFKYWGDYIYKYSADERVLIWSLCFFGALDFAAAAAYSLQSCPTLVRPYGLYVACQASLCPWDSPGKSTGAGCHALLQGVFPTQGANPGLLHCGQILYLWATRDAPWIFLDLHNPDVQFSSCCLVFMCSSEWKRAQIRN